jgi:bacteriocin biosynthesis cyclodehydratase domain-containing protein
MNSQPISDVSSVRLRAFPVQLLSAEGGVVLVRGVAEIFVAGDRATELVPALLAAIPSEGISREDLIERFAAPDREEIGKLIDELVGRSILAPATGESPADPVESNLDVFYWHFGQSARTTIDKMSAKSIVLIGVNTISRRIAQSLHSIGVESVEVVDFPILRNLRLHGDDGRVLADEWPLAAPVSYEAWSERLGTQDFACIVATSDFGGPFLMREWNSFCVQQGIHFLPVVLNRFTGTIGPLVIPGETACYECLRLRENANMDAPEMERVAEFSAPERQSVTGFHPAMTGILGELASMELCKIYGGGIPWRSNYLIEVNLLGPAILTRRVLKLPLCPVCSPALKTSSVYLDKESFVPGHQLNFHEFR